MSRRSKKVRNNIKIIKSSFSSADRLTQLNRNACDPAQNYASSHLESIGNSVINGLKGSERDRLKERLLTSCVSNTNNLVVSSSRRSLKQLLADFHTFDCHIQRQYRTIGIGDNDVNANIPATNIHKSNVITQPTTNKNMLNDESEVPTVPKRRTRRTSTMNPSRLIKNEINTTPNVLTRTICTRSSKLNTLNNNEEPLHHVLPNRARKRRSSSINNTNTQTQINTTHSTAEKSDLDLPKSNGDDVSGVKVSRKKVQSSIPSSTIVDYLKTTNDF